MNKCIIIHGFKVLYIVTMVKSRLNQRIELLFYGRLRNVGNCGFVSVCSLYCYTFLCVIMRYSVKLHCLCDW